MQKTQPTKLQPDRVICRLANIVHPDSMAGPHDELSDRSVICSFGVSPRARATKQSIKSPRSFSIPLCITVIKLLYHILGTGL